MKYKLKKNNKYLLIGFISIVILFILSLLIFSKENKNESIKNDIYDKYVSSINPDEIVLNYKFSNDIASLVTFKDNIYNGEIYNYKTGDKLTLTDIIKKDKLDDFQNKVKELLNLKYPKFIAEVLENTEGNYAFYEKYLIIYYYNVTLDPSMEDELSLTINYKEIKDYLVFNPSIDEEYSNEDGFKIDENKKHIALTFDDGPSKYTEKLSNILLDNKAHATFFFVTKNVINNSNPVIAVNEANHEIGYHSYNHTSFKRQTATVIKEEYNKSNEYLEKLIGKKYYLTRPPYGAINNSVKQALDTPFILWDIDTNDWRYRDSEYLYQYVLDNIKDGDIILFHDSYESSIEAIKKLLPKLYTMDYQVVTVSTLANIKGEELITHGVYRYFK